MTKKAKDECMSAAKPASDKLVVTGTIEKATVTAKGVDVTFKGLQLRSGEIAKLSKWIDLGPEGVLSIALTPVQGELYPDEPAQRD